MILHAQDTLAVPLLSGQCAVYGKVYGDVRLTGTALVISGEEICNDTPDTLLISGKSRSVIRSSFRDQLSPKKTVPQKEKPKSRGMSR